MPERLTPPMGPENLTSRTCSRQMGMRDGREILCGKPGVQHVFYWWDHDVVPAEGAAGFDHGFCCAEHWAEYQRSWSCAFHHDVNAACGMPGSVARFGHPCEVEDLPVAEPVRAVAEPAAAGREADR